MLDDGKCGILILLSLSVAFDTLVHKLLLDNLVSIGINDNVLQWLESYLTGKTFCASIATGKSENRQLVRAVPQGTR